MHRYSTVSACIIVSIAKLGLQMSLQWYSCTCRLQGRNKAFRELDVEIIRLPGPTCSVVRHHIDCSRLFIHYITAKQVGCFNHRVVTMVADKLETQWLWEVRFWYYAQRTRYVQEPGLAGKKVIFIPDLVPFSSWFLTIYSTDLCSILPNLGDFYNL